ncbi:hypothetical protein SMH99_03980 [Spiroplasma poulsonii]|nr:hypothetical protein SMSE_04800 [Spiroplasma poulsonii]PWF97848.1 hypothetical protein SMH99_03980 [Spiroplasma poulsonii]
MKKLLTIFAISAIKTGAQLIWRVVIRKILLMIMTTQIYKMIW